MFEFVAKRPLYGYNRQVGYPNRSHGISEGANTVRHFYGTLTRYLHEHLPAGGRTDLRQKEGGRKSPE